MVQITYFVHGTTQDNENGIATGWLPGKLSNLGIKQSHILANIVKDSNFDVVICSDLKRAVDTAQIVFGKRHKIIKDTRLREANYGDWNGKSHDLFKTHEVDFVHAPFPNGESYKDVEKRMHSFCQDFLEKYDGKKVALLAHQAPQLALEVITNHKSWEQAIADDWRKTKAYQSGWQYQLN